VNILFPNSSLEQVPGEILVLFHFEDHLLPKGPLARVDWILNGLVSRLLYLRKFQGLRSESLLLSTSNKFAVEKVLVLGLGKRSDLCREALRGAYSSAILASAKLKAKEIALTVPREAPPSLFDDLARGVIPFLLTQAAELEILPSDLRIFFYEKDPERRGRLMAQLREGISGIWDEVSTQITLPKGDFSCAT
jgi:hypothetical protein